MTSVSKSGVYPRQIGGLAAGCSIERRPIQSAGHPSKSAPAHPNSRRRRPRQTRRRFGGRQPLCGIGVTSRIEVIANPTACSARKADSRPEPGPFTSISRVRMPCSMAFLPASSARSEEHTSELQSRLHLVCRLLLEKKKKNTNQNNTTKKKKQTINNK